MVAAFLLLAIAILPSAATADTVLGSPGSGAGQYRQPAGVALDSSTGELFVADTGNRRVDVFDSGGEMIRAFGWGVVASGPDDNPRNEIENVTVTATGGSFALVFVQNSGESKGPISQETGSIPFNASSATVQAALEALPAFEPGDVAVSGGAGGPWTVEFTGFYADTAVRALEAVTTKLTGPSSGATIEVLQPGANYEVCMPGDGDVCRSGQAGSASGQFLPKSIAVDSGSHNVYIFDIGAEGAEPVNRRVQAFTSDGAFLFMLGGEVNKTTSGDLCTAASGDACGRGEPGTGSGEFNSANTALAIGPGGVLYVNDGGRIQKFSSAGSFEGQISLPGASARTVAVDSAGNIYVNAPAGEGVVRKYSPAGVLLWEAPAANFQALAIGEGDQLYISDTGSGQFGVSIRDELGALLKVFYPAAVGKALTSLALPAPATSVFGIQLESFGPGTSSGLINVPVGLSGPVVYPVAEKVFADHVGNVKATLHSLVNPEGKATTYHFEYISDEDFLADGETFGAGTIVTPESASIGSDFTLASAQREIGCRKAVGPQEECLAYSTLYHFRVVATNADAPGGRPGPVGTFLTKPPIEFGGVWSTDVGTDAATLHAEVNPLGLPGTARFQYVEQSEFEASGWAQASEAPVAGEDPIDLGEGEAVESVSVALAGLSPGTVYRYRLFATNRCKAEPEPPCEFGSPERTFTTFSPVQAGTDCPNDAVRASGSGTFLPDCRGYELVSPVDKEGVNVESVSNVNGFYAGLEQAAVDGNSITYSTYHAFGNVAAAPYTSQYLARRGGEGWVSEAISPRREGPSIMTYEAAHLDRQYRAFSPDLCQAWMVQDANPILAPGAIEGFPGLYHREDCGGQVGGFEALLTAEPPNLAPRKVIPELQGTSADGSVAIFSLNDNLTIDAAPQPPACVNETSPSAEPCQSRVYEARKGQPLNLVCILPNGEPFEGSCATGGAPPTSGGAERSASLEGAVSEDGSRIFWTGSKIGPGRLFVRIDGTETIEISSQPAQFYAAASDGSKVIYSVGAQLFEYDVETEVETPIAGGLKGVAGASKDVSRVYFASSQALTGEEENSGGQKAKAGEGNLYLYEAGAGFKFVGTLDPIDFPSGAGSASPVALAPLARFSRVTPDGEKLAFMAVANVTGYDNTDVASGEPDFEVYLYDAQSGQVLCPSCNPSNERPKGRTLTLKFLEGRWAAARIPAYGSQLYGQRILSEGGNRLYFNSFESLVPTDTNGKEDVYQWETLGSGGCNIQSPTYHAVSGGCVDSISSGKNTHGSELVDISADGSDVFFRTGQSLVSQDPDLRDIYDARVEGGFPPLSPKPVICEEPENAKTCPEEEKPTPPEIAPASRATGPGNAPQPASRRCPKGKRKVIVESKTRCVGKKKHRKKHTHHHKNRRHKRDQSGRAGR